ncbi:MAG: hypothetical protein KGI66_02530 [Patescibacteria group bacterium]|nr:hypothetical protein [Patescibacteria group bacterium]
MSSDWVKQSMAESRLHEAGNRAYYGSKEERHNKAMIKNTDSTHHSKKMGYKLPGYSPSDKNLKKRGLKIGGHDEYGRLIEHRQEFNRRMKGDKKLSLEHKKK